jgi:hypothetical protein
MWGVSKMTGKLIFMLAGYAMAFMLAGFVGVVAFWVLTSAVGWALGY